MDDKMTKPGLGNIPRNDTFDYEEQAKYGATGVALVQLYEGRRGNRTRSVESGRLYDLDLTRADGSESTLEVKYDSHLLINFAFEMLADIDAQEEERRRGCFLKSRADYWYYAFEKGPTLFVLPMPDVRLWVAEERHRRRGLGLPDYRWCLSPNAKKRAGKVTGEWSSICRLVPIREVCAAFSIKPISLRGEWERLLQLRNERQVA
jgi:hypothetical protein